MGNIKTKIAAGAIATAMALSNTTSDEGNVETYLNNQNLHSNVSTNEGMGEYDKEFLEFYKNGQMVINNVTYDLSDLFILLCQKGGQNRIMLLSNDKINKDIFTGESYKEYKKISISFLRDTTCFYNLYLQCRPFIRNNTLVINGANINSLYYFLLSYDGSTINENVPDTQTGYGR